MFDSLFDNDFLGHSSISDITHSDIFEHMTDPVYSYLPENVYHDTPIDPTYHDDLFGTHGIGDDPFSITHIDTTDPFSNF